MKPGQSQIKCTKKKKKKKRSRIVDPNSIEQSNEKLRKTKINYRTYNLKLNGLPILFHSADFLKQNTIQSSDCLRQLYYLQQHKISYNFQRIK